MITLKHKQTQRQIRSECVQVESKEQVESVAREIPDQVVLEGSRYKVLHVHEVVGNVGTGPGYKSISASGDLGRAGLVEEVKMKPRGPVEVEVECKEVLVSASGRGVSRGLVEVKEECEEELVSAS